ncbi:lysine N(6)-hydroxylase/L-ornithine N(5)-oxygenase family protein [Prauserella halophila]|uniref:L-lysine N6-monooxygenase MbtG n=1 Tax=Prauserella halophila TaxID=185641 RepID=A0ABP4HAG6_9PSEU|nr:lysine N(6)-hydroxylase/L-ornithine N(5)-oxygenase family protein [Prauserella halophila]MCP2237805.1 L-ornithine N5-oxygenase [Prauserella halophila]
MTQGFADDVLVYDLVGVGFGPSNLALAVAVAEYNEGAAEPVTAQFLEKQGSFGWHRGMLVDDATMQVSFLKDLATLRNPTSRFSFLSYLHDRGRLVEFVNHKTLFPLRAEFHDYFEWSAAQVGDLVSYGSEVVAVEPVFDGDEIVCVDVRTSCATVYRARNVVLATGLRPRVPDGAVLSDRIWHNSELLQRVPSVQGDARRFVVVGAGQSAAEVTAHLHSTFPAAEVCAVFSRFGYSPSDDSPLANRIFDPASVDEFFGAPEDVKDRLMDYHANTNYSVVDLELIEDLYRRLYRERVLGHERLRFFHASRATDVVEAAGGVRTTVESLSTGEKSVLDADVVVYATGYLPADVDAQLDGLAPHVTRDPAGRPRVERDYRVHGGAALSAGVYLQGGATEHTHGITSSLLSNNAIRSGEILDSVLQRRRCGVPAEFAVSGP